MSSWLRGIFIAALVLAGLSLFILAATSTDSTLFERWFPVLLVINRAIAVVLFAVVAAMTLRLWQRLRNKEFGAHLTSRLALSAAGLALIPCVLIYFVSSVFISRSINSWFDVRVEKALDSGVTIPRGILARRKQLQDTSPGCSPIRRHLSSCRIFSGYWRAVPALKRLFFFQTALPLQPQVRASMF